MRLKKYNLQQLKESVKISFSYRATLAKLDVSPAGGNYEVLKKAIKTFGIDISHFTGKGHLRNKTHDYRKRPLLEILVLGRHENTWRLKNRLIQEGLKEARCEGCSLKEWLGKPVPLELHHKNGNRKDNRLVNLLLVCPNCHAFTDNYRGKNKSK